MTSISNITGKHQQQHQQASAKSLIGFSSNLQSHNTSLLRQVDHSQCQASITLSLDDINSWCTTNVISGDNTLPQVNQSYTHQQSTLPPINTTNTKSNGRYVISLLDRDWSVTQLQEKVATNNSGTNTYESAGVLDFATPFKELAYPVGTVSTYASIPPNNLAKRGETKSSHEMGSNYSEVNLRMEMNQATGTKLNQTTGKKYFWTYSDLIACTPHPCWKHMLQRPDYQELPSDSNKFSATENLLLVAHCKRVVYGTVLANDETVKSSYIGINNSTGNGTSNIKRSGTLTFEPSPEWEQKEQHVNISSDKEADLMHQHHCLGQPSFLKLKNLAETHKMSKQLANGLPLVCEGCAFGAIPKVLPVFMATRSCYRFIHLVTSLLSKETVAAKHVFEWNTSESCLYILHYHSDNDCFFEVDFQAACKQGGQHLEWIGHQQPVSKTALQCSCQTQSTVTRYNLGLRHHGIHSRSSIMKTSDPFNAATKYTSTKQCMRMSIDWQGLQAHPGILAQGTMIASVGSQPWQNLDLTKRKQGSTNKTAVIVLNLQWPSERPRGMQGSANTKVGRRQNIWWIKNGVPTVTQWSGSPNLLFCKQMSSTLAKPSLCWPAAAPNLHARLHLLVIQVRSASRSHSTNT